MIRKYESMTEDYILQEDLNSIAKTLFLDWEKFNHKIVLVTGATGLLGSQIVFSFLTANRIHNLNIKVIAVVRNEKKANDIFKYCINDPALIVQTQDILNPIISDYNVDFIIHGASVTSSKNFVEYPVETIKTAVLGTLNMLEFAKKNNVKGFVYLSSLEVYGVTDIKKTSISEEDYGYINPLSVRSSYIESKRLSECLCTSYSNEYKLPITIARLAQTFGPGVSMSDERFFAQLAKCVINKENIVLYTMGNTIRNYCYTKDSITAVIQIMLSGESGNAYNVANKETTISIKEMAEMVVRQFPEANIKVEFDLKKNTGELGYAPVVKVNLSTVKLEKLGWKATVSLEDMLYRTVHSMEKAEGDL